MSTIKLSFSGKEIALKWNSSMRLKDFMTLNDLKDETTARQLNQLCYESYAKEDFKTLTFDAVTKWKESAVLKKGGFRRKLEITADGGSLKPEHAHLIDLYIEKKNAQHGRSIERALMEKQRLQEKPLKATV